MMNSSSRITLAVTRIRTEGLSILPGWAWRWLYWNARLYRLVHNPFAQRLQRAYQSLRWFYKSHKPRKKYGIQDPVVVYQMGKVGSRAVSNSLLAVDLDVPVYHVHILTDLDKLETFARQTCVDPTRHLGQVNLGRRCRQELFEGRWKRWNVISLTRDPVKRTVSAFFQNILDFIPDFFERYEGNAIGIEELTDVFLHKYYHNSARDWFDAQLKPVFGIDVFATEFPRERGFQIYTQGGTRLLVMRVENLNDCAPMALQEFLGIPNFKLLRANVSEDKSYSQIYREFVKTVRLPSQYLDEMYSSRYVRHFYSPQEIADFRKYWQRSSNVVCTSSLLSSDVGKHLVEHCDEALRSRRSGGGDVCGDATSCPPA